MLPTDKTARSRDGLNRCPEARALLSGYVEGELSGSEMRRIAGHLALCAACSSEEALYRQSLGALRQAQHEQAPHRDLYAGFEAKLARYENRSGRRQWTLRWAGAAGCLLLVAGASASYLRQSFMPTVRISDGTAKPLIVQEKTVAATGHAKAVKAKPPTTVVRPESNAIASNDRPESPLDIHTPPSTGVEPERDVFTPITNASRRSDRSPENRRNSSQRSDYAVNTPTEAAAFWRVRSEAGHSAEDIIKIRHPQDSPDLIPGPGKAVSTTDVTQDHIPHPPDNPDTDPGSNGGTPTGAPAVSALIPNKPENVVVNGKVNEVQTAVGYNAKGRRVLIKVDIEPRAKGSKEGKEKKADLEASPEKLPPPK